MLILLLLGPAKSEHSVISQDNLYTLHSILTLLSGCVIAYIIIIAHSDIIIANIANVPTAQLSDEYRQYRYGCGSLDDLMYLEFTNP